MHNHHIGDPCIHCKQSHDEVESGPCPQSSGLAAHTRAKLYWQRLLEDHEKAALAESTRLRNLIMDEVKTVALLGSGFDEAKILLAESVMYVHGEYAKAGEDRDRCRQQAIKWFSTGETRGHYGNLQREYFGTKDYDRWHGRGSDHDYGYGPSHGSIIFAIGLVKEAQKRELSDSEKDAAIYYLMNLEIIQQVRAEAKVTA